MTSLVFLCWVSPGSMGLILAYFPPTSLLQTLAVSGKEAVRPLSQGASKRARRERVRADTSTSK